MYTKKDLLVPLAVEWEVLTTAYLEAVQSAETSIVPHSPEPDVPDASTNTTAVIIMNVKVTTTT